MRGDAFCGFCQCNTCTNCLHKPCVCVCVCTQRSRAFYRQPMETAYLRSAPLCMLMYRKVDRHYSSTVRFLQLDQSRTDGQQSCQNEYLLLLCHISASIPPQSSLRSRMTFQLHCHFYWFSCCVGEAEGVGGRGDWERERGREGAREGKWERALVPQYEQKMEPVSALHAHVLEMTLKSSCNQTAYPRLSLSVATVRSGIAAHQLRLSVEEGRCRTEGEKERRDRRKEGRICGLSLTLQNSSLSTPLFWQPLCDLASAPGSRSCGRFHCDWLPSPISNTSDTTSAASPTCQSSKNCWLTRPLFTLLGLEQPKPLQQDICQSQNTVLWLWHEHKGHRESARWTEMLVKNTTICNVYFWEEPPYLNHIVYKPGSCQPSLFFSIFPCNYQGDG